jgi:hypothetical protein
MTTNFRKSSKNQEIKAYDPFAHALTVIQEQHRMNHDGFMFHASGKVTGMVDTNVDDYLITTPAATFPHFQRVRLDLGGGDFDIQTYEAPTTSAAGTVIPSTNTNRNSSNTADTVITSGPTVSVVGTLVHTTWAPPVGTGIGQSANGISNISNGEEWILAPSTEYLIRLTNNSGATIDYRYEFLFYEIGYEYA